MKKLYRIEKRERRLDIYCRRLASILLTALALFVVAAAVPVQAQEKMDEIDTALKYSGDFRLRYENTSNNDPTNPLLDARNRMVVRFRAGITKRFNQFIDFGARLATGSPDDPNTADVTLGDFVDDLTVSLDRVYLGLTYQDAYAVGGKFANPFMRTDLVWDGDVNPEGAAARYTFSGAGQITPKLTGIFFIVDEQARTDIKDSKMIGGQGEVAIQPSSDSKIRLAGSYYDYDINSLVDADIGDTRSNYLDTTGAYVSDFDLLDILATAQFPGFGPQLPILFVGDYVKNLGANVDEDTGFSLDLFVGKASKKNDLRFRYGYSEAETDAVLAAFSHDNTSLATNYQQHTVTIDYVALASTTFNVTWYYYHKKKLVTEADKGDWISRLRLNAVVKF